MSGRWYKRCGADFIHGTIGLSLEEKGAYSLCLDLIYDRGGPIPDDARWLSGICGVSLRKWNSIRDRLISVGKLSCENGFLMNVRAGFELENLAKTHRNLVESGAKGGRKRAENETALRNNNDLAQATLKHHGREEEDREKDKNNPSHPTDDRSPSVKIRKFDWPEDYRDLLWKAYPRKTEKKAGMQALEALFRKDCTEFAALMEAARRVADTTEPTYAKALHRWIKGECWNDEITPRGNAPPRQFQPQQGGAISTMMNAAKRLSDEPNFHDEQSATASPDDAGDFSHGSPLYRGAQAGSESATFLDLRPDGAGRWSA